MSGIVEMKEFRRATPRRQLPTPAIRNRLVRNVRLQRPVDWSGGEACESQNEREKEPASGKRHGSRAILTQRSAAGREAAGPWQGEAGGA